MRPGRQQPGREPLLSRWSTPNVKGGSAECLESPAIGSTITTINTELVTFALRLIGITCFEGVEVTITRSAILPDHRLTSCARARQLLPDPSGRDGGS